MTKETKQIPLETKTNILYSVYVTTYGYTDQFLSIIKKRDKFDIIVNINVQTFEDM